MPLPVSAKRLQAGFDKPGLKTRSRFIRWYEAALGVLLRCKSSRKHEARLWFVPGSSSRAAFSPLTTAEQVLRFD